MHIVLLESGDAPGQCGVGDYTRQLAEAFSRTPVRLSILSAAGQPLADLRRQLAELQADVLSIQYPTRAFGASLKPHLLAATAPCPVLITLHEYSQAHRLRRLSLRLLARISRTAFLFTSAVERNAFLRDGVRPGCVYPKTIPIGSNIPFVPGVAGREPDTVVHFGLLRPERGIEAFLELAAVARRNKRGFRFCLLGGSPRSDLAYARDRIAEARALGVDVQLELPAEAVAALLARSQYGYLPFPQGADERRGSLLALLGNGVCTLTCTGVNSPRDLMSAVESVSTPEQALVRLEQLRDDNAAREALSRAAGAYARQFTWSEIARRYLELFDAKTGQQNGVSVLRD
jgi:glycosyltransferase involved in cell wall biosynthesis